MNALLNVFINVLTATGEVKALTLTLTELEAGDSTYLFETLLRVLKRTMLASTL